jgi:hypothetical protein
LRFKIKLNSGRVHARLQVELERQDEEFVFDKNIKGRKENI